MHVAIIGCGQLARLLAQAGKDLGITTSFIALENESIQCVKGLGRVVHWHRPMSIQGLLDALDNPDVITVERENVDVRLMLELSMHVKVYPSPECVATCKNRLKEKLALSKLNIAATPWLLVDSAESVKNAVHTFGLPVVIKA
ncbi:MAG: 5-(carboxyamino)imidazole ribonucleotide synthase, partial [Kangiellaceae bacterium]